jgi:protein-tyrosine phosphatase
MATPEKVDVSGMATTPKLDASNVATRLWVGGRPPFERDLPGFDLLVLCARELQPDRIAFHGTVIRCPLRDDMLDHPELTRAVLSARAVGDALIAGKRALVTCSAGLNRSALVASLALTRVTRMTPDQIIAQIRQRRSPNALFNTYFQDVIRRLARRR